MSRSIRRFVFALVGMAISAPLLCQVPEQIWIQGQLTDETGIPLAGPVLLEISIFDSETGGTLEAQASFVDQDLDDGTYAVALPAGTISALVFDRRYWIETKVDGAVAGPRTELGAVPYALGLRGIRVESPTTTDRAPNIIGGYTGNFIAEGAHSSVIAGGGARVAGNNRSNFIYTNYSAILGGVGNSIGRFGDDSGDYTHNVIGGGLQNSVRGSSSFIGGGTQNVAGGGSSVIGGGTGNHTVNSGATIGGGGGNEAGYYGTVGGGLQNMALGQGAVVPGGSSNAARGVYSFAGGSYAKANHEGSFVWSDNSDPNDPGTFKEPDDSLHTTGENQFLIRAAGGVGIDTNTPGGRLDVADMFKFQVDASTPGNRDLRLYFDEVANDDLHGISLVYAGKNAGTHTFNGTTFDLLSNRFYIIRHTASLGTAAGAVAVTIERDTGHIGIGKQNPAYALDVEGQVNATNVAVSSDARMKRDIGPIDGALEKVQALEGVSYSWDPNAFSESHPPDGRQFGLLAQDVAAVLPEVVFEADDGTLSVSYQQIVPVLIEAIKEERLRHDRTVSRLEARISRLESELHTATRD